jgi:hypothetical protein
VKKIKTFIQACKKLGLDASKLPDVSCLPDIHQKAIIAHYKLIIIAQALNDGWQPNWNDSNQGKYYPWFEIKADTKSPGGSGLVYHYCDLWYTLSMLVPAFASKIGKRLNTQVRLLNNCMRNIFL